ncbi:hypothetical protein LAC03_10990 [Levilactobacillus acidifarinae]|nr:hypothetical protein LAC03_10990 [Levilactobacillus acidifarinae]
MVEATNWLTSMLYILAGKYDESVNFLAHPYEFCQFADKISDFWSIFTYPDKSTSQNKNR